MKFMIVLVNSVQDYSLHFFIIERVYYYIYISSEANRFRQARKKKGITHDTLRFISAVFEIFQLILV